MKVAAFLKYLFSNLQKEQFPPDSREYEDINKKSH